MMGRGIALLFHDRGTRRRWVFSSTPRPLYPRNRSGTHFARGWVGPRAGLDGRKISSPTGIRFRTVQPVAQSRYRLSYRFRDITTVKLKFVTTVNTVLSSPLLISTAQHSHYVRHPVYFANNFRHIWSGSTLHSVTASFETQNKWASYRNKTKNKQTQLGKWRALQYQPNFLAYTRRKRSEVRRRYPQRLFPVSMFLQLPHFSSSQCSSLENLARQNEN